MEDDKDKPKLSLVEEPSSKPVMVNEGDVIIPLTSQITLISRAHTVEKRVNNHLVDNMPHTHHISRMMASAFEAIQMRYLDMIHRHEPWRRYDNYLFVDVNDGFPDAPEVELEIDGHFELAGWDLYARRLQAIIQRIRKTMDSWGNPESVGKLWALERESDDYATYQVRVARPGQEDFEGIILMFEPSEKEDRKVKMTLVEIQQEEIVPIAEPIHLNDSVDPVEQMNRLTILFTQGHLMTGLYETFRTFNH